MRVKNINFTTNTVEEPLGYIGEYNETQLLVTPPTELAEDNDIVSYRLAFGVNGKVFYSEASVKAETFTVDLWSDVTASAIVYIQVEGVDNNGEILAKSKTLGGKFLPSVTGVEETAEFTPPIIAEIAANTAARHTHANKTVIDGFAENNLGELTYKGNGFATDEDIANKQDKLTAGDNITITGNTIAADNDMREILSSPGVSAYTPTELSNLATAGKILTYEGTPILSWQMVGTNFYFTTMSANPYNEKVIAYRAHNAVNSGKAISLSSPQYIPTRINSKLPNGTTGEVTLRASDITAASGWTPSNDTDLATKKYVDDNAGGTPDWSDIQNKPASYPPSAHTHAYSEITNTPDLSVYALSASLGAAATSNDYADLDNLPTIPDISGCEVTANKVTALSSASTDTQYPSAKCVYDALQGVSGWVASPTAPLDTSLLWIDTSDNTVEDLADADNTEY